MAEAVLRNIIAMEMNTIPIADKQVVNLDDRDHAYWRQYLAGLEGMTRLPFTGSNIDRDHTAQYESIVYNPDDTLQTGVVTYVRESKVPVEALLVAGWSLLLYLYTDATEVCFGVCTPEEEREAVLPVRCFIKPGARVSEYVDQLQQLLRELRTRKPPSPGDLRDVAETEKKPFDALLVLCQDAEKRNIAAPACACQVVVGTRDLAMQFIYDPRIISPYYVKSVHRHFQHVLTGIVSGVERVDALELTDEQERRALMRLGHGQAIESDFSYLGKIFGNLDQLGTEAAITFRDKRISYSQLRKVIDRLCLCFQDQLGLTRGNRVVVLIERTEWMLSIPLSLLRMGLVYIPIDNSYPDERINYILHDVQPSLVIVEETDLHKVMHLNYVTVSDLSDYTRSGPSSLPTVSPVLPSDPAYVLYTSGSTGMPKGVMVSHGNLDNFFRHVYHAFAGASPVVLPFMASNSFDISLYQLFTPLLSGGMSIIVGRDQLQNLKQLTSILKQVTLIDTVPAVFELITDYIIRHKLEREFDGVTHLNLGGDAIQDDLLKKLTAVFRNATIMIAYGPTEATIFCTFLHHRPGAIGHATRGSVIGRPIGGTSVYILDSKSALLPVGLEGEICVGGACVTQGYLNKDEETRKRFVYEPAILPTKFYRTGDLGRWTEDGMIEFRGRNDNQVKIRGHRIELGEIENALLQHPMVRQAVVVARELDGLKSLVGYVVPHEKFDKEHLTQYLKSRLPEFMLPALLISLKDIPLTSNGKVDKKALPLA